MKRKVFIGVGHGGSDPGATANGLKEKDVNLVTAAMMKVELERHGVNVGISRMTCMDDRLSESIKKANAFKPEIAIDIHNNAGGGKGFEAYRQQTVGSPAESLRLGAAIETRVKTIGQNSRGIKGEHHPSQGYIYGWLKDCQCTALLVEGAFLDNPADVQMINTITKQEAFGVAYAQGTLDYLGIPWNPAQNQKEAEKIMYGVMQQVIALSSEESARKFAAEMNKRNPDEWWFITEKRV